MHLIINSSGDKRAYFSSLIFISDQRQPMKTPKEDFTFFLLGFYDARLFDLFMTVKCVQTDEQH